MPLLQSPSRRTLKFIGEEADIASKVVTSKLIVNSHFAGFHLLTQTPARFHHPCVISVNVRGHAGVQASCTDICCSSPEVLGSLSLVYFSRWAFVLERHVQVCIELEVPFAWSFRHCSSTSRNKCKSRLIGFAL